MNRRTKSIFLGFILLCCVVFTSLGIWQIKRLAWKTRLLADIETARALSPQDLLSIPMTQSIQLPKSDAPQRIGIAGRLIFESPVFLRGQILDSKPASAVLVRFCFEDDICAPIFLGLTHEESLPFPSSQDYRGIGWVKKAPYNFFTSDNNVARNLWFRADRQDLKTYWKNENLTEVFIYLETPPPVAGSLTPMPIVNNIRNNHLQYALFWFTAAALTLAIGVLRLRQKA